MSKPADCPNCGKPTASDDSPTAYADRHDPSFCSPFTSPSCWGDGNPGFFHDGRWVSLSEVQPIAPISQQQEQEQGNAAAVSLRRYARRQQ